MTDVWLPQRGHERTGCKDRPAHARQVPEQQTVMAPMVGIQHHNLAQGGCGAAAARGADGSVNWTSAATAHLGREHRPATRLGHVHGTSLPHSCNHTTQILPTDWATCTQQYTEITPQTHNRQAAVPAEQPPRAHTQVSSHLFPKLMKGRLTHSNTKAAKAGRGAGDAGQVGWQAHYCSWSGRTPPACVS